MDEKMAPMQLTPEELENVGGGASDYSTVCGMQISVNCAYCTKNKPGQVFHKGEWKDCIGCSLSMTPLGNIDGYLLINNRPIPMEGE